MINKIMLQVFIIFSFVSIIFLFYYKKEIKYYKIYFKMKCFMRRLNKQKQKFKTIVNKIVSFLNCAKKDAVSDNNEEALVKIDETYNKLKSMWEKSEDIFNSIDKYNYKNFKIFMDSPVSIFNIDRVLKTNSAKINNDINVCLGELVSIDLDVIAELLVRNKIKKQFK